MKRILFILLFLPIFSQAQTSTELKQKIDDSITTITSPRTIRATNVGARMKEIVDFAQANSGNTFFTYSIVETPTDEPTQQPQGNVITDSRLEEYTVVSIRFLGMTYTDFDHDGDTLTIDPDIASWGAGATVILECKIITD